MKLWVGLGNPGAQYADNRHNIGFRAVEAIAEAHGFPPWRAKFQSQIAEGRIATVRILALKPDTFMNLSGDAVQAALRFYKLTPRDLTVFHDELDLGPGVVRVKTGGGLAGHNGLRSIAGHIGPDFARVRLGIGHPGDKARVTAHVLGDFAKADADWLDDLMRGLAKGAPDLAARDTARFLNAIALARPAPPRREMPQPETPKPVTPQTSPPEPPEPEDGTRTALQRLADRFR